MEQPACNGRCLGWLSVSLIDHYVRDKPSMALAVENKVANFFIKTINSATQKVDKVRTCSKVAKHKQFLESFIFRISVGFSFLIFCSSATLETINIWNASIYNLHLPFFCGFFCGWLTEMKDDVAAIPDMNRKFLFDFSTIMLAWRLNSLKLLLLRLFSSEFAFSNQLFWPGAASTVFFSPLANAWNIQWNH